MYILTVVVNDRGISVLTDLPDDLIKSREDGVTIITDELNLSLAGAPRVIRNNPMPRTDPRMFGDVQ